jgi:ATP-binding cassette, subfamily F, member 3
LAKTLISEANFLLLDEPTNHLDFISENILIQALQQYLGSFVVVSHNRHFVRQIANKIWYIEDKQIKEYPGTYDEYEYWRKKNEASAIPQEPTRQAKKVETEAKPKPSQTPSNEARLKSLEKDLKKVEEQVTKLEGQKTALEIELTKPEVFSNTDKLREVQGNFKKVEADLDEANNRWTEIATAIDDLNKS